MIRTESMRKLRSAVGVRAGFLRADVHEFAVAALQHGFDHNSISAMGWLRPYHPILRLPRPPIVLITRRDDVLAILKDHYTFPTPYGAHLPGPFVLGLEGDEHAKQRAALTAALNVDNLREIMGHKVQAAAQARVAAVNRPGGMDVGADLIQPVLDEIIADFLGIPGPDSRTQWQWARDIFENIFLNFGNTKSVRDRATVASEQMSAHVLRIVDQRAKMPAARSDVLGRLLDDGVLNHDEICSSMIGLAIGWLWHGARAALIAVDELLNDPDRLTRARAAAQQEDHPDLAPLLWEIFRFRPVQAFVARTAAFDTVLAAGTARETRVRKNALLLVGTHSAMWDEDAINCPARFDPTRADGQYLIFGRHVHRCLGEQITRIQLPALLAPLLALGGLRRADGRAGRLHWAGPRADGLRVVLPA